MMILEYIVVLNETIKEFLDSFHISKTLIYQLNQGKAISVNGTIRDINYQLCIGDNLKLDFANIYKKEIDYFEKEIKIIYNDEDIVVVNKDSGILVHSDGNTNNTLTNAINFMYKENPFVILPVQRLDVDTSGIIVFAKNPLALSFLSNSVEEKHLEKKYLAIVSGILKDKTGTIDKKIGKNRHTSNSYVVCKNGKSAKTNYKVLMEKNNKSLLEIEIESGRTHQIRVHLNSILHPIIGDKIYGNINSNRLMLHSNEVGLIHPRTRKYMTFDAKVDNTFKL